MKASYAWLRDFVDCALTPHEIAHLLTARCATVEDIRATRTDLSGVVVGRVVAADRHPNSDRLWVTKVDAGSDRLFDVVCGAPTVETGTLYPFAPAGSTLPGGLKLEKRKIRGAVSEGMLCSARELGLGEDHEGILALDVDAAPGTPFLDVVEAGDSALTIDVLPNRPDLMSHEGLAREIAAATGASIRWPLIDGAELRQGEQLTPTVQESGPRVEIQDTKACPTYSARIIRGVRVAPSPPWLVARLATIGMRSINNVVDCTNYMLHGFGQPMHAFDFDMLAENTIVVRRATPGERIRTLDGAERELDPETTVIADAHTPQAIAGVIGGAGSEVTPETRNILLEVAAFDPKLIRATRRRLGVSTDASHRFERGVDLQRVRRLADFAVQLIIQTAGGSPDAAQFDFAAPAADKKPIRLRTSRVGRVLGEPIETGVMTRGLAALGFEITSRKSEDELHVLAPSFRQDVHEEIDVIEEVARVHGYDAFPSEIRPFRPGTVPDAPQWILERRVREVLVGCGLVEARPLPFVSHGPDRLRILNALAEDEAYLRTSLLASLAKAAEYNLAHMVRNVRLFEIGTAFTTVPDGEQRIGEATRAAVLVLGDRYPAHFTNPKPEQYDEWDAKALAETLACAIYPRGSVSLVAGDEETLWNIRHGGQSIGLVRRVDLDAPVWASPAFGIEIELRPGAARERGTYTRLAEFPASEVDLALLLPDGVTAQDVESVIRDLTGELLEALTVFDEFRGESLPRGTRSVAWRLTFRHSERTLRDREIQGRTARILKSLEEKLGVRQRTS